MKKQAAAMLLSTMLLFGSGTATFAQEQNNPKHDLNNAARSTKKAAKKTGRAVKKGTKKGVHAGAKKTRQAAGKAEEKTRN